MPSTKRKPRRDSDKCSIINRTVSFNIEDPFQAQLLKAVDDWTNFSGSVKRLIAATLSGEAIPAQHTYISEPSMGVQAQPEPFIETQEDWDPTELF